VLATWNWVEHGPWTARAPDGCKHTVWVIVRQEHVAGTWVDGPNRYMTGEGRLLEREGRGRYRMVDDDTPLVSDDPTAP
jgi:hypothetical protein